jgi:hypothetical protein
MRENNTRSFVLKVIRDRVRVLLVVGWRRDDWDCLAGAQAAGHVLECGAQATGGNHSFFTELDARRPGFPLAELHAEGTSIITKHEGSGGAVSVDTVTARAMSTSPSRSSERISFFQTHGRRSSALEQADRSGELLIGFHSRRADPVALPVPLGP